MIRSSENLSSTKIASNFHNVWLMLRENCCDEFECWRMREKFIHEISAFDMLPLVRVH